MDEVRKTHKIASHPDTPHVWLTHLLIRRPSHNLDLAIAPVPPIYRSGSRGVSLIVRVQRDAIALRGCRVERGFDTAFGAFG